MKTEPVLGNDNLNKEIIQWGCKQLLSLGYKIKNNLPENVLNTPWSYVIRFETYECHDMRLASRKVYNSP
jgi:hypothetical protein